MPPYSISIVSSHTPEHNEILRQEMISVLRHAYVNPEKVIDKRFFDLEKIFLLKKEGKLLGFCTYTIINLQHNDRAIPSVFLGITAASPEIQNTGLVLRTLESMKANIMASNPNPSQPRLVWGTTASPSSLAIFRKFFNDISPDFNNNIRPEHIDIEKVMRLLLLQGKKDTSNIPLVVRNVSPLSAYSEQESLRIQSILNRQKGSVFNVFDIDDARGDRLIFIGNC